MGFLDFLGGGGGGLITGLAGTIAGAVSSSKDRDLQRELQQQQMAYGEKMYALQSKDESQRMPIVTGKQIGRASCRERVLRLV